MRSKLIFTATAFTLSLGSLTAQAVENREEAADRVVDQAAVDMQGEADQDLAQAVKAQRGTAREAEMLMRLSELRLEIAEGLFRVAYAPKEKGIQAAYRTKLSAAVASLTRVLSVYPKSEFTPRALFLRGKAEKELGNVKASLKDFEEFLTRFPGREESPVASLAVADISIATQNFKRAVSVLSPLLLQPSLPAYSSAVAKRAWAFYSDSNPLAAVRELKLLAAHFSRLEDANQLSSGDRALRESLMGDVPTIAYMAFSKDRAQFNLVQVNALLRSFDRGEGYHRMALRMMDHLRTADRDGELRTWKALVLKSDPARAENLQMLIATFSYDLERESYAEVVKTAAEMSTILAKNLKAEGADEARKLVVRAGDSLTKRITDYRNTVRANDAEKYLAALLTSFEAMTSPEDTRRVALRWNLAETYFGLEKYERAAQAYRSVALNWGSASVTTAGVSPKAAALKAISSRYEALRAALIIPQTLTAQASARATKTISAGNLAAVREWIQWLDTYTKAEGESLESFQFEASRTLYQAGFQDEALSRLKQSALAAPGSRSAIASASLVMDTWIARARWDQVESEALVFSEVKGWAKASFAAQMKTQASVAKFKRAELAYAVKNYSEAGVQAREFLKNYSSNVLAVDAQGIACNSAVNSKDFDAAVSCLDELAARFPRSSAAPQALRTAARIEDDRMNFSSAADRYVRYLNASRGLKSSETMTIRKRILQLTRATGNAERMEKSGTQRSLCTAQLASECELNRALAALIRATEGEKNPSAVSRMSSARRELRAIWASVVLEQWQTLDRKALDRAMSALVLNWKATDASVRYFLIARATKTVPALLARERTMASKVMLTATERSITTRMRLLQNMETRARIVGEIPVTSIQAAARETVYFGYSDLIADMRAMPAPAKATAAQKAEQAHLVAGLVQPLILKSRKIRDSFAALDLKEKQGLNGEPLNRLGDQSIAALSVWAKAIQDENWSRVSFLSNEVMDLKSVPAGWAKAARAVSLASAGAAAEAKIVFGDACRDTTGSVSLRDACRSTRAKGRG